MSDGLSWAYENSSICEGYVFYEDGDVTQIYLRIMSYSDKDKYPRPRDSLFTSKEKAKLGYKLYLKNQIQEYELDIKTTQKEIVKLKKKLKAKL